MQTMYMDAYIAGSLSGFVQILIGHPLDTYKVWLQTGQKNKKFINIYNGIKYPLVINCIHNSVLFGTNNYLSHYINNQWITGFITGIASSFICGPMELYKIRDQSYKPRPNISQIMIGFYPTLLRECITGSLYFGTYHYLYHERKNSCLLSGGIAGVFSWLISHPIDTIKSQIQSGKVTTIKQAVHRGGLWKGIYCTLVRAFLVNSVGFWVYEKYMSDTNKLKVIKSD